MKPLEVVAILQGDIVLPNGHLALDGLLAASVAREQGIPPAHYKDEIVPIDVPLEKHASGAYHLASVGHCEVEESERRWINRRYPVEQAQTLGEQRFRSYKVDSGACRSYRMPVPAFYARDDAMTWWAIGDRDEVERLLQNITYVGKKRSTGHGRVREWRVRELDEHEVWEGFPVMREGMPLRALPLDTPGLSDVAPVALGVLSYPYWARWLEQPLAMPAEAIKL